MNDHLNFDRESLRNIRAMAADPAVREVSQEWINTTGQYRYVYNWKWLGLPIIQLPADIVATQEIIWQVRPTVIVETGVARGGSIMFNTSQLALLDFCESSASNPRTSDRRCIGIDIDIRGGNRAMIEDHPLAPMITLLEGSSIASETVRSVGSLIRPEDRVMVILDSNHTHEHVIRELELYSGFVSLDSYLIVHDTGIEMAPHDAFSDRDWARGNNPFTAVQEFLAATSSSFVIDHDVSDKLLISSSPKGYLRRVT